MRHRLEDELARYAFGELTASEAEKMRQVIASDPVAAKVHASFKELAEGLRTLDVPQHQLSTDRLRHAILNRGLKPERPNGILRWSWMPVAAGLFGFLLMQSLQRPDPISLGAPAAGSSETLAVGSAPSIESPTASTSIESPSEPTRIASVSPEPAPNRPRLDRRLRDAAMGSRSALDRADRGATMEAALLKSTDALASAVVEGAVADELAPTEPESDSIIIIGSDRDVETGAQRATEVSSTSNVVVGG